MKTILFTCFILLSGLIAAQNPVSIKGEVQNLDGHQLIINYKKSGKRVSDKITTANGKFETQLSIDEIQEVSIYSYRYNKNVIRDTVKKFYYAPQGLVLFVAPGDQIIIQGNAMNMWSADVKGGKHEKDYNQFRHVYDPLYAKEKEIKLAEYEYIKQGDSNGVKQKRVELKALGNESNEVVKKFYTENTSNAYAMFKFLQKIKSFQPAEAEKTYQSYSPELQQSEIGKKINSFLEKNKGSGAGVTMIDFDGVTLDGKTFDSKNLRGSYVLLDFWGSWCGPCRKSNPHLKELYAKYKSKGFEIVGIAYERATTIDKAKLNLKKAVEQDGLPWPQLLNKELEKKLNVIEAYNVGAYPTKVLIDKNGVIIWKAVGAEEKDLDKLLAEIFGE